jgi:aminoglycoside phosphotransferase (APT) family kinase protein
VLSARRAGRYDWAVNENREIPLTGGQQTPGVVRIGATVRRPMGSNAPFVHELLRYLQEVGFDGAPRLLGVDERGREVLSFVEGEVPHDHGGYGPSEVRLTRAAALIRRFHDVTADSSLTADAEIVAHNELGPHNTVFAGDEPVAFIDWDDAAPGTRLFDLSNAVWSFANVGEGGGPVGEQARLIRLMCDAYGWDDPHAIVDEIHADLRRARTNHERAGRLKVRDIFQEMITWMDANANELKKRV